MTQSYRPIAMSLLECIGKTDLLEPFAKADGGATIYAKVEGSNPGGSVKDRIALSMLEAAEAQGHLKPGVTVVEASSGNTGIGLAWICAIKGYRLVLFMPDHYSLERRQLLEAYGAKIVLTDAARDMDGARQQAMAYCQEHPEAYLLRQFENPANPKVHEETTGPEILADLPAGMRVSALVLGVGTGGALMGVGRVLKATFPQMRIVAVEPQTSAVLSGQAPGIHAIHGIGAGFVPPIIDRGLIDEVVTVADADAFEMAETLARTRGLLVGVSSGANLWASRKIAQTLPAGTAVVTFLCDQGQRYFSFEKASAAQVRDRHRLERT